MDTSAGFERWGERPRQRWYLELLENLRSGLTWLDAFVGFCAIAAIAIILISFRYQVIPEYEIGQIADQEVRAVQDVVYEDRMATDLKRAEAEATVPSLYQLESDLIADHIKSIASAFSAARDILAESVTRPSSPMERETLLKNLDDRVGGI
jgi:membrane-associated HD superfamily phosphohydrolase